MNYRRLGKTNLMVSEIGLGAEWLERCNEKECIELVKYCEEKGINILDCWMSEPNVRSNLGKAIKNNRNHWIIQGHIGSTWQNNQYVRSRDLSEVKKAFADFLSRLNIDYVDLGMIHYVDEEKDLDNIIHGPFLKYVKELKEQGKIKHIGMSTHNPLVAIKAIEEWTVEMIMFSINPLFDFLPPTEDVDDYFKDDFDESLSGINPIRKKLYQLCEERDVGITVMKGFAGGRLFNSETSAFKVALTPVQCLHYALTRPGVSSVLVGFSNIDEVNQSIHYENATQEEKDYASILANTPSHAYQGECTYCGHCAPCPKKIDIAMVNKLYDLATIEKVVPSSVLNHYQILNSHASNCIECGGCMKRCPFHVNVIERMKKANRLFKL